MESLSAYLDYPNHQHQIPEMTASSVMENFIQSDQHFQSSAAVKVDPSYKSKRYRDKLRTEIKALELLLPVDKSSLHRKLDSQTVFRLVIAYFRTKMFLEAAGPKPYIQSGLPEPDPTTDTVASSNVQETHTRTVPNPLSTGELLQALDGFLIVVTADGTILYVSRNIVQSLGFNQVDLMHRCFYGIVHPDDHHELKMVLETSLQNCRLASNCNNQKACCSGHINTQGGATCKAVSFLVRIKCFNGTTTGYLKMHCTGQMRSFPGLVKSSRTSNQVVFAFCRPFASLSTDPAAEAKAAGFWSKHALDLSFKQMDIKVSEVIGYTLEELEGMSFYRLVHPEDLAVFSTCHKTLIHTEEIQTMYFRVETKQHDWMWLHTRGKVVFKNSKKYSIVFTHCPVREEDSTYIQQEAVLRRRHALRDVMVASQKSLYTSPTGAPPLGEYEYQHQTDQPNMAAVGYCRQGDIMAESTFHSHSNECPSTWHAQTECHSPVFPTTNLPHKYLSKERVPCNEPPSKNTRHQENPDSITKSSIQCRGPPGCGVLAPEYIDYREGAPLEETFCSYNPLEAALPRHYLMQLNGVGVSPQMPPTTVVFQGQLTAIETNRAGFLSPPWMRACAAPSSQSHFLSTNGNAPQQSEHYAAAFASTGVTNFGPTCRGGALNAQAHLPVQYDSPYDEEISNLIWNHWNHDATDCCVDVKTQTTEGVEAFGYSNKPSCLYQSHYPGPWEATCHVPPATTGKTEVASNEKRSRNDLPAIGSFLEYLKDISG